MAATVLLVLDVPQRSVRGIMGLIKHGDGRSYQHVELLRALLGTVAFASVPLIAFARVCRSTHLAGLRIEKSLGSDNLMTCFQAEPTWRG
ncbi:MAG: hypothetical protein K0Q60_4076, partial [Microvirga sp.]|nr:hypothetical protein [Microvirga sp.]